MNQKKAIVIIPTYNEKDNIERVISSLLEVFNKISDWQMGILIVDDTSPDGTYKIVEKLQKKHPELHLLINQKKSGLGGAYLKGMDMAFNQLGAEVVFEFDADLSHDPSKIPAFLAKIDQGSDMVLGSRYIAGGGIPADWGWHRKFLSIVGNIIIMVVLTDFKIRDWTTGFRAITKKVYEVVHPNLHKERFSGYTFQIGFLHQAIRAGFKVVEVPFVFVDREHGHSKLGPEYIKNTLSYIFRARIKELLHSRFLKFAMVGGLGAIIQLVSLQFWRMIFPYQLAFFLAIELAVLSNFLVNNVWTFADRKLSLLQMPLKFLQFNLASGGSIVIQQLVAIIGEFGIGLFVLFSLPILNLKLDTGTLYAVIGIGLGMFWNFFAYNYFIWKKK